MHKTKKKLNRVIQIKAEMQMETEHAPAVEVVAAKQSSDASVSSTVSSPSKVSSSATTFSSTTASSVSLSGDSKKSSEICSSGSSSSATSHVKICKKKVFVENLEWNVHENLLKNFLKKFGTIKRTKIIRDNQTNKSKGFGYVEFEAERDAESLIQTKPVDLLLNTRPLRVSFYKEKIRAKNKSTLWSQPLQTTAQPVKRLQTDNANHADRIDTSDASRNAAEAASSVQATTYNELVNFLPYNVLVKIFSYLCLRDRCIVEQGAN